MIFHGFSRVRNLQGSRHLLPYHRCVPRPTGRKVPMNPPTYDDVVSAAAIVYRFLKPTPLYEWSSLSALPGCRFYLKHENHTPTTAFKVRGGINLVARLSDEQKRT